MRTQTAGGRKDVIYCLSLSSAGVASARMSQTSRPGQTPKEPPTPPATCGEAALRETWRGPASASPPSRAVAQFYYEPQPVPTQAAAQTHFVFRALRTSTLRESWERSEVRK